MTQTCLPLEDFHELLKPYVIGIQNKIPIIELLSEEIQLDFIFCDRDNLYRSEIFEHVLNIIPYSTQTSLLGLVLHLVDWLGVNGSVNHKYNQEDLKDTDNFGNFVNIKMILGFIHHHTKRKQSVVNQEDTEHTRKKFISDKEITLLIVALMYIIL